MSSGVVANLRPGFSWGAYPERVDRGPGWFEEGGERVADALLRRLSVHRRRLSRFADRADELGKRARNIRDGNLPNEAALAGAALRRDGFRSEWVARAFALVREAAYRELGKRHFPCQLMGGRVLLGGSVAEMETGEGKTLTATLPACTAALAGIPVHVISVNDYLVARDAEEMGPVYRALGLRVGAIQHGMDPETKRAQYACDVTYVSNKEIAFDYLRDRITLGPVRSRVRLALERASGAESRAGRLILRGLCFGIVDEADSVLIDEARTPLIISGAGRHDEFEVEACREALALAAGLEADIHYVVDPRERCVRITGEGESRLEALASELGGIWRGPKRRAELVGQALSALELFERDRHYLVRDDKVHIIDEHTGRLMSDRSWQRGLHQMVEAKEGVAPSKVIEPLAKISYQRFFRRYLHLAGMTGTAREIARELWTVYGLPVVRIPTHRPLQRRSMGVRVHVNAEARWSAVLDRTIDLYESGRPVLVGTRSVAASEHLSRMLDDVGLPHRVLNARQDREEAAIVAQAGTAGTITIATNMAGRGTDIRLDPQSVASGGLHVIATELHESRRIDRQLFGRCGRQGDPGTYEGIVSLEDDLLREHGISSQWFERATVPLQPDAGDRWRLLALRRAQWRAERLHGAMRRQVLKQDDQLASLLAFSGSGE